MLIRFARSSRGSVSVLRGLSEYARGGVLIVLFPVAAPDFSGVALEGKFGITELKVVWNALLLHWETISHGCMSDSGYFV